MMHMIGTVSSEPVIAAADFRDRLPRSVILTPRFDLELTNSNDAKSIRSFPVQ